MQAATVKITQQQRIDGVKAKHRTEKGHMDGAAAGGNKVAACLSVKLALLKNQAPPRYSNENSKYGESTDRNILRKKDHL